MSRPRVRVAGIPIVVDPSWLIIAVLVTWVLFAELANGDGTRLAIAAAAAVAGALTFFGCLLAHELSHSVVARRRGLAVRRIRLFVFGGVSEIEQEAGSPSDELAITAAGPAASLLLAGAFLVAAWAVPSRAGVWDELLELLAVVNLALALFNLLPGFPLDGGRVLRAVAWRLTGSFARATRIAVWGGRVIALLLGTAGAALLLAAGDPGGLWWIAIGWFLYVAADRSLAQLRVDQRLAGVAIEALAGPVAPPVVPQTPLGAFEESAGYAPVVAGGRVRGLVDLAFVAGLPARERARWTAADVMLAVRPADVVEADRPAADILGGRSLERPVILVRDGRMVGLVARRDVAEWVAARRPGRFGSLVR